MCTRFHQITVIETEARALGLVIADVRKHTFRSAHRPTQRQGISGQQQLRMDRSFQGITQLVETRLLHKCFQLDQVGNPIVCSLTQLPSRLSDGSIVHRVGPVSWPRPFLMLRAGPRD